MDFELALAFVIDQEGGYSHRSDDPETNFGITRRTARVYGYRGSMRNIRMELVRRIYARVTGTAAAARTCPTIRCAWWCSTRR